jgi:hypothetical protein
MARIDPKDDELGMMENIFRGVRSSTSGAKTQGNDDPAATATPNPSQKIGEPNRPQEMQSASTEGAPSHIDPSDTTHQEPQS